VVNKYKSIKNKLKCAQQWLEFGVRINAIKWVTYLTLGTTPPPRNCISWIMISIYNKETKIL